MKKIYFLLMVATTVSFAQTTVFINEIHYANGGLFDSNEGVEIAGPPGTNLSGWNLIFYDGATGNSYHTEALSGTIGGSRTLWFNISGIQNGSPDGIALVDNTNTVVQFLSYEGTFVGSSGLAAGMTATNIGVSESSGTSSTQSLQLSGSGIVYEDFTWNANVARTPNLVNNGQSWVTPSLSRTPSLLSALDYNFSSGPSSESSFTVSATNLVDDLVITAPTNFEIRRFSTWSSSISISNAGTVSSTTIYVRLKQNLPIGIYTGAITIASLLASNLQVALNGSVRVNGGDIIITEIMTNPNAVSDANGEYFELYNTTASSIDINGWSISDLGTEIHTISSSVVIPANGYAVLARNATYTNNGNFNADYDFESFQLANTSDEIILKDPSNVESDRVEYNDTDFTFEAGKSIELSLGLYDSNSNDFGSNWGVATTAYGLGDLGTPGSENNFTLSVVKNDIEGFEMYPNPVTNGKLYFVTAKKSNIEVEIYNILGQKLIYKVLKNSEYLDFHCLNSGIYFVKITEEKKIATRKLLIH